MRRIDVAPTIRIAAYGNHHRLRFHRFWGHLAAERGSRICHHSLGVPAIGSISFLALMYFYGRLVSMLFWL